MIASLTGILREPAFTEVIIDVNGVGYLVFIPLSTFDKLPKSGEKISLLIHMYVREDDIQLFGFATEDEKRLFRLLLSVSGIGPKIALNVLSTMSVSSFCNAISKSDLKMISQVNGIGKKTSELIVLELRNKIKSVAPETAFAAKIPDTVSKAAEEAVLALVQLGFKYENAAKTVHETAKGLDEAGRTSENLIRLALRSLNG